MKNLGQMMKQAQQVQAKMQEVQEKLTDLEVTGAAGGGLVSVVINGKMVLKNVKIDPSLAAAEEAEVLEDLIIAAYNEAKTKAEIAVQDLMAEVTGGLNLPPGFSLPF